jgi:hypothetical protein
MVVSDTVVAWDAPLNEKTLQILGKYPSRELHLKQERIHVEAFHEQEWPNIRLRLRDIHDIHVTDEEEPHWMEPWKAAFWKPSEGLKGEVSWTLTSPLSADAVSISRYMEKGFRFRNPLEAAPRIEEVPLIEEKPQRRKRRKTRTYTRRSA